MQNRKKNRADGKDKEKKTKKENGKIIRKQNDVEKQQIQETDK